MVMQIRGSRTEIYCTTTPPRRRNGIVPLQSQSPHDNIHGTTAALTWQRKPLDGDANWRFKDGDLL
ncbi:hypothetical protein KIN20_005954 [Parelaphostrongylus tenuis]|uniref:Uncharacterized protein n=1 Tax=Parelaphostrongylus tenuis TaxID=148309 RepID=A0AAD5QKM1_PARTN|nr:hypothetical protein KIN20_005954 [Parelaphostrongylus tenuis]